MAIAPNGFLHKMQCIPIDLIDYTNQNCYEYVMPSLCLMTLNGKIFYQTYGYFQGECSRFRLYDIRAESGMDTRLDTERGGCLQVTGAVGGQHFPPLRNRPVLEIGQFLLQEKKHGVGVECVYENLTYDIQENGREVISSMFIDPTIRSIGSHPVQSFKALLEICANWEGELSITWMDGRIDEIIVDERKKRRKYKYGMEISSFARLWYHTALSPDQSRALARALNKEEPEPAAEVEDDCQSIDSCTDPCIL